jgi:preprotein translocase subunit YajC|tara:strand:- start:167 stop:580 length:414 start_codon:yes stop_codon:yes gene_type:complete
MHSTYHTDIVATVVLAQFGEEAAQDTTQTEVVDGSPIGTNDVQPNPLGGNFFTIMMVVLVGMIVFSMFGGRKQKKKRLAMLDSLQKRDTVLTRGGVFGTIVEIKPDRIVLKVDESSNTRITVLRDSIEQVTADTSND